MRDYRRVAGCLFGHDTDRLPGSVNGRSGHDRRFSFHPAALGLRCSMDFPVGIQAAGFAEIRGARRDLCRGRSIVPIRCDNAPESFQAV